MRIGHYAPHIWAPGGIATYVRRLGTAQENRGYRVVYLSQDAGEAASGASAIHVDGDADLFRKARDMNLDVLHLHKPVSTLDGNTTPLVRTMHGHQASCPSGSRYLARPGCPCDRTPSVPACLWGRFANRCGSVRPARIVEGFSRLQHEIRMAHHMPVIAVSTFLRNRMIEAGCPADTVSVIPSPAPVVPSVAPMPQDTTPRFLFLGRLVPQKGILWLLRAVSEARSQGASLHLDVAGDGDLAAEAHAFVAQNGLEDDVTFHGWVGGEHVESLIQSARAVVFPSVWHEPAGLVSLEAAAHGRALIASRAGGIPEYAREEYAVLVPPNDTDALAEALVTLASDADYCAKLGRRGHALATTTFAMDDFLDRMDTVYASLRRSSNISDKRPDLSSASSAATV